MIDKETYGSESITRQYRVVVIITLIFLATLGYLHSIDAGKKHPKKPIKDISYLCDPSCLIDTGSGVAVAETSQETPQVPTPVEPPIEARSFYVPMLLAVAVNEPPYQYKQFQSVKGMSVELITTILSRTGTIDSKVKLDSWRNVLSATRFGQADLLLDSVKSNRRQQWGQYLDTPLFTKDYVVFKRKYDTISFSDDNASLAKLKITVPRKLFYTDERFKALVEAGIFAEVMESRSTEKSIERLISGKTDLVVGDYLAVQDLLQKQGNKNAVDVVLKDGAKYSVATKPVYLLFSRKTVDDELIKRIDKTLEEMKADGSYQEIIQRYSVRSF